MFILQRQLNRRFHKMSMGCGCNFASQFDQSLMKETFVLIAFSHDSFFSSLTSIFVQNLTLLFSQVVFGLFVAYFVSNFFALNDVNELRTVPVQGTTQHLSTGQFRYIKILIWL